MGSFAAGSVVLTPFPFSDLSQSKVRPVEQVQMPMIRNVHFPKDELEVELSDGRRVSIPLAWYPRLAGATKKQLKHYEISPSGYGIHWPEVDEDLSVHGFLYPG